IVAAGLAAAALTPLAGASSAPACATGNLSVSFTFIPGSPGAGNVEYTLKVKNTGANSCSLGKPTVTLLGKSGAANPSHSHSTGAAVTVPAGGTAKADARFSPDVAGTGDTQSAACQPVSYKVKVAFKGSPGTVTGPIKPPTRVCERGSMSINAL